MQEMCESKMVKSKGIEIEAQGEWKYKASAEIP